MHSRLTKLCLALLTVVLLSIPLALAGLMLWFVWSHMLPPWDEFVEDGRKAWQELSVAYGRFRAQPLDVQVPVIIGLFGGTAFSLWQLLKIYRMRKAGGTFRASLARIGWGALAAVAMIAAGLSLGLGGVLAIIARTIFGLGFVVLIQALLLVVYDGSRRFKSYLKRKLDFKDTAKDPA